MSVLILTCSLTAAGQRTPPVSSPDSVQTLKVDVTLVPVHVVVRDTNGQAVGNLTKDDFQVFDQGKAQVIKQFSIERSGGQGAESAGASTQAASQARLIAYLFDDLHLGHEDLTRARESADRQLASLSPATDRAAIFTTSGRKWVDFTADRTKLHEMLAQLEPRGKPLASPCPAMTYYMADLIADKGDREALSAVANEVVSCAFNGDMRFRRQAAQVATAVAREKTEIGKAETANSLRVLKALVEAMSTAPGRRMIVLVSPGFFVRDGRLQEEITELAVRSDVAISALDPRGLVPRIELDPRMTSYETWAGIQDAAVLEGLTDATGGTFFHNNNDVDEGFRRVSATPEYSYVLAFAPQNLKFDGRFRALKVTVNNDAKLSVQARRGCYAPKRKPRCD
ncbi:MAG: VWA domain-containing protein [Terriglobales bacterium]